MKQYFYSFGNEQFGPFSFEELKDKNIAAETLIWFEGLDKWTAAKNIKELQEIIELNPPPLASYAVETINDVTIIPPIIPDAQKKNNKIIKKIFKYFGIMYVLSIATYLLSYPDQIGKIYANNAVSYYVVAYVIFIFIIYLLAAIPALIVYAIKKKFWKGFFTMIWIIWGIYELMLIIIIITASYVSKMH
jgi:hypothetical protein